MWEDIHSLTASSDATSFLDALEIWIKKPHVINRRLCGAKLQWQHHYSNVSPENANIIQELKLNTELQLEVSTLDKINVLFSSICEQGETKPIPYEGEYDMFIRDLLPKSIDKQPVLRELILKDYRTSCVYFVPLELKQPDQSVTRIDKILGYKIQLESHKEQCRLVLKVHGPLEAYSKHDNATPLGYTLGWLKDTLLPKLTRWSCEKELNTEITSLRLVPVDKYSTLYNRLKQKYGIPLVEKWPEKTDPQKFVFEDVAIATYLLLLWEDDRGKKGLEDKQSFVDLGCGNGLLVYILTSEGHPGLGLDLRRRKIWDMFDSDVNLKEQTITPSDEHLFPQFDWLIGNHSDELTPWIPVMAARSSYTCCYFVLPCCPWDFATKFSQKVHGVSQYRSYLNYIQDVGNACGFDVEEDTLRIPSTKRVCFIGRNRSYSSDEEALFDMKRQEFINNRCSMNSRTKSKENCDHGANCDVLVNTCQCPGSTKDGNLCDNVNHVNHESITNPTTQNSEITNSALNSNSALNLASEGASRVCAKRKWADDFRARDNVERPRNCVTVQSEIKDKITETVFKALLNIDTDQNVELANGLIWRKGGRIPLSDVASMFDADTLIQLKSECGGLQTLLRNCHHVFRVQAGHVTLRDWTSDDYLEYQKHKKHRKGKANQEDPALRRKIRLCYFYLHHPDGCPLESCKCRFAHGEKELQTLDIK